MDCNATVAADRAVRGQMSGCKVQRSFKATTHRQVFGRSGRSEAEPAITAAGWLAEVGRESLPNGSFLTSWPVGNNTLPSFDHQLPNYRFC